MHRYVTAPVAIRHHRFSALPRRAHLPLPLQLFVPQLFLKVPPHRVRSIGDEET